MRRVLAGLLLAVLTAPVAAAAVYYTNGIYLVGYDDGCRDPTVEGAFSSATSGVGPLKGYRVGGGCASVQSNLPGRSYFADFFGARGPYVCFYDADRFVLSCDGTNDCPPTDDVLLRATDPVFRPQCKVSGKVPAGAVWAGFTSEQGLRVEWQWIVV